MIASPADIAIHATDLALIAWCIFWLVIAVIIGLNEKRRPSIAVDLFILALVGAHIFRMFIAGNEVLNEQLVLLFSFIPIRQMPSHPDVSAPGGWAGYLWSPFTYAFLHGNGLHLFGNAMALFAFGRTVAWRIGAWNFVWLFAGASAAGALVYQFFNWGDFRPLIGASAGIFGIMAATFRFVPRTDDRLKALFWPDETVRAAPLATIGEMLTERRSQVYLLICTIMYPIGLISLIAGTAGNVAVTAHLGGFAFGLFAIEYFDRRGQRSRSTITARPKAEPGEEKRPESAGLRLLRIVTIVLMVLGIISGLLFYYWNALLMLFLW